MSVFLRITFHLIQMKKLQKIYSQQRHMKYLIQITASNKDWFLV